MFQFSFSQINQDVNPNTPIIGSNSKNTLNTSCDFTAMFPKAAYILKVEGAEKQTYKFVKN